MEAYYERLSPKAREVHDLARDEARRYARPQIGAEHLLLGIIDKEDSTGARILRRFGVEPRQVRSAVEMLTQRHRAVETKMPELSARALAVLSLAYEEAQLHQQPKVGSGHMLLGLIRDNQGIPAGVLASMGVGVHNLEQVRDMLIEEDQPPLV